MNIRDLTYLIAVADHRHFSKAAEACFVSQPGLSTQIKKLEETLGVKLIERNTKSVLLTEIGEIITQQARDILHRIEAMKEIAHQAEDPFSGTLHLGLIPTLAPYLLPHILPTLATQFPKISLYLVEDTTAHLLEKLSQGKLDAALLALPTEEENLLTAPLFEETFVLAVSTQHPLAMRKKIKVDNLQNETLLLLEEGHCLRDQALNVCHQTTIIESTNFQATSLETLKQMVAFNGGITLMPKLSEHATPSIAYIPFSSPQPKRTIGMIYRSSTVKKILLDAMIIQIKESLSTQPVKVL
jgi:LysR family hydrogen peroxide-inducible transcriptional activator